MTRYSVRFINTLLMYITLMCIVYALIALEWDYIEEQNHYGMPILAVGYITGIISCILSYKKKQQFVIVISILYGLQIIFSIIISANEENIIEDIIKNTIWIIIFFMAYLWGKNNYNFDYAVITINTFIIPLLCVMYVKILSSTLYIGDYSGFRDAIFPLAVLSPFIFFCKNVKVRLFLFIIVAFFIIISAKRSVILGVVVGLLLYLIKIFKYSKNKRPLIISFICGIIISCYLLMFSNFDFDIFNFVFSRFDSMADGDSNGRDTIIDHILLSYQKSDLISQVFGHGSHSTIKIIGKLAHNDILQILYDYGLFSLISFLLIYISLIFLGIKFSRKHRISNNEIATYWYSLILFIFLGMLNCYISTPRTFTISMFIFGYLIGKSNSQNMYAT